MKERSEFEAWFRTQFGSRALPTPTDKDGYMIMKTRSEFDLWFEAQHGKRTQMTPTDKELVADIHQGDRARVELDRRIRWDDKWSAALYAWQARDQVKGAE